MSVDVEQRIRERAYAIWLEEGCPHGRDADHWRLAEQELAADGVAVKAPRRTTAKKASVTTMPTEAVGEPAVPAKARKPRTRKPVTA
ncbi:DUF2934 domain-containing protein [Azospirillum sp. TSO35-2]|uniref:DUF2934 domain-containing protein n=1 Tax=Azospirillum sp. TSO35-2 TaxID=716796 RepID=UPI000D60E9A4|nr:DUF2934 domain-containing protein [Azospirillum sp. TSO35-2]PWC32530.1 hypothetical protein TSO352_17780 [Azospirillum sp. TSO35-2]